MASYLGMLSGWMGGVCLGFVLGFLLEHKRVRQLTADLYGYRHAAWELSDKLVRAQTRLAVLERNSDQD